MALNFAQDEASSTSPRPRRVARARRKCSAGILPRTSRSGRARPDGRVTLRRPRESRGTQLARGFYSGATSFFDGGRRRFRVTCEPGRRAVRCRRSCGCIAQLQGEVRRQPADSKLRVFLAQLLMADGRLGTCTQSANRRSRSGCWRVADETCVQRRDSVRTDAGGGVRGATLAPRVW